MKKSGPVTQNEVSYASDARLISTTTPKGVMTYANDDFCRIAGYSLGELEGQAHNLVRHPDMPPAAFSNLWDKMETQDSWMGIVKNRAKNGDHYWVDAFVTPIMEQDKVSEIQSVRTQPDQASKKRADTLYKKTLLSG